MQSKTALSFAQCTPAQLDLLLQSGLNIKGGIDPNHLDSHKLFMRVRGPGVYCWNLPTGTSISPVFPGKEPGYETSLEKAKAEMKELLKTHPEVKASVEKTLPDIRQWQPWATVDTELDGQIHGLATQIWISIQTGDECMYFYTG